MFGKKNHTLDIVEELKIDLENHNFNKCKDEWCPTCNYKLDETIQSMKLDLMKSHRQRLPKSWSLLLQKYFPKKMLMRALNRYSRNEIFKKQNYNQIPCRCDTKKHVECDGIKLIKFNKTSLKSVKCPCKKHLRVEVSDEDGKVYL